MPIACLPVRGVRHGMTCSSSGECSEKGVVVVAHTETWEEAGDQIGKQPAMSLWRSPRIVPDDGRCGSVLLLGGLSPTPSLWLGPRIVPDSSIWQVSEKRESDGERHV